MDSAKRSNNFVVVNPGDRFGLLAVTEEVFGAKQRRMRCLCDCGQSTVAWLGNLRRGHTRSCGCERIKVTIERNFVHGLTDTPEYKVWCGIARRCYDERCKSYSDYGGRGIVMAPEWRSDFTAFLAAVGQRPTPRHTIERIKVNGNYAPGNVTWATRAQQNRNTRANNNLTIDGETRCLAEWDEVLTARHGKRKGYFKYRFHRYGLDGALSGVRA